jgi:hypothetical protein
MDAHRLLDTGRREPGSPGPLLDLAPGKGPRRRTPRIRCPLCRWQPDAGSLWQCACGAVWNTFQTRGRCPECAHQWTRTMCLSCHRWSSHDAWYEGEDDRETGPPA